MAEEVCFITRSHVRTLLPKLFLSIALLIPWFFAIHTIRGIGAAIVQVLFGLTFTAIWLIPWLRWLSRVYVVTDRRALIKTGVFRRDEQELPLTRVISVRMEQDFADRPFRCGTLILTDAANDAPLRLTDVPNCLGVRELIRRLIDESPKDY